MNNSNRTIHLDTYCSLKDICERDMPAHNANQIKALHFLKYNNISAWLFGKRTTNGCRQSFEEKKHVLELICARWGYKDKVSLAMEIKTIVFDGKSNGNTFTIAIHIPADMYLPVINGGAFDYSTLIHMLGSRGLQVDKLAYKRGVNSGTVNPLAFLGDINAVQIFDSSYLNRPANELVTTNACDTETAVLFSFSHCADSFRNSGIRHFYLPLAINEEAFKMSSTFYSCCKTIA